MKHYDARDLIMNRFPRRKRGCDKTKPHKCSWGRDGMGRHFPIGNFSLTFLLMQQKMVLTLENDFQPVVWPKSAIETLVQFFVCVCVVIVHNDNIPFTSCLVWL